MVHKNDYMQLLRKYLCDNLCMEVSLNMCDLPASIVRKIAASGDMSSIIRKCNGELLNHISDVIEEYGNNEVYAIVYELIASGTPDDRIIVADVMVVVRNEFPTLFGPMLERIMDSVSQIHRVQTLYVLFRNFGASTFNLKKLSKIVLMFDTHGSHDHTSRVDDERIKNDLNGLTIDDYFLREVGEDVLYSSLPRVSSVQYRYRIMRHLYVRSLPKMIAYRVLRV